MLRDRGLETIFISLSRLGLCQHRTELGAAGLLGLPCQVGEKVGSSTQPGIGGGGGQLWAEGSVRREVGAKYTCSHSGSGFLG